MNQQLYRGLTVTLLLTALGTATSSYAKQPQVPGSASAAKSSAPQSSSYLGDSPTATRPESAQPEASNLPTALPLASSQTVVKVGEQQSQSETQESAETIASIHSHPIKGREAATLYIRQIPVLTFLGKSSTANNTTTKVGATAENSAHSDPIGRASEIAAKLNQFNREKLDANNITVQWNAQRQRYIIQAAEQELVVIDSETILPDTTRNPAEDALQATNRLRRLMGNAPPLKEVAGRPAPKPQPRESIAVGPIRFRLNGMASWYGPGFHGNRSASGEVFNQHAMTAAHKELPFGTQVRVTNLDNGRSVVVRINDRGPFTPGRIIDLSAAAAQVIGLMQSGVAPVRVDVLGRDS